METYTTKQMQDLQEKVNKRWNDEIKNKYILLTDYERNFKIFESKKKKEFRILLKAMQDLNKTIENLKEQEVFLNDLIDERDRKIKKLEIESKKVGEIIKEILSNSSPPVRTSNSTSLTSDKPKGFNMGDKVSATPTPKDASHPSHHPNIKRNSNPFFQAGSNYNNG